MINQIRKEKKFYEAQTFACDCFDYRDSLYLSYFIDEGYEEDSFLYVATRFSEYRTFGQKLKQNFNFILGKSDIKYESVWMSSRYEMDELLIFLRKYLKFCDYDESDIIKKLENTQVAGKMYQEQIVYYFEMQYDEELDYICANIVVSKETKLWKRLTFALTSLFCPALLRSKDCEFVVEPTSVDNLLQLYKQNRTKLRMWKNLKEGDVWQPDLEDAWPGV